MLNLNRTSTISVQDSCWMEHTPTSHARRATPAARSDPPNRVAPVVTLRAGCCTPLRNRSIMWQPSANAPTATLRPTGRWLHSWITRPLPEVVQVATMACRQPVRRQHTYRQAISATIATAPPPGYPQYLIIPVLQTTALAATTV